jgi:transposase-like protein
MVYSPTQFQKGLSLPAFLERYGTEDLCVHALFKARWPKGFECPECGGREYCVLESRHLYQCNACRRQTSVTAGTIFHKTYLPLTKWFLAMHLLTQGKHSLSALELKRQIGVSYETAWKVKHKLMQVMLERERGRVLSERIEADDAYMGGERHGGKRGRGSPGKTPMLAAVQTSAEEDPSTRKVVYLKVQAVPDFRGRTIKRWAQRGLARASTVLTDGMPSFNAIGEVVQNHQPIVMEGGWRNSRHPAFKWVNTILGNLKGNLLGVCRWISAKHLPRYLAEFQWRFNRRFHLEGILERLLRAAALTPPMPQRLLVLAEKGR